jgi:5-methylthioadenosine/S-adenosylhomocysteine deaminase
MATSKTPIDLLINARWVLPIRPAETILEHHSVAINQGKIIAIKPTSEATAHFNADSTIDLGQQLLMPGLINAHGHSAMTLLRGITDDKPLHNWLNEDIWPAEAKWVSEEFVRDGTNIAIGEMLLSGTTCFSDQYFFPETIAEQAQTAGIRAQVGFPILDFPTAWGSGPDDYLSKGLKLFDKYRNSELINIAFAPHATYTVGDDAFAKIVTMANETDAAVQIHLHETAQEVYDALQAEGVRPIERLKNLGLLSPRLQCVHMTQLNDADIALLSENRCHVIHCPQSNMKLASGSCEVDKLQKNGINVALGTDGAASNNALDMFSELQSAALLGKLVAKDATAISAFNALEMATINGAIALGLDESIGSLEVGKHADMIAVDLSDFRQQPLYNPISQLVYTNVSQQVTHAWVSGKVLVSGGKLTTLSEAELATSAINWQQKICNHNL